MATAAPIHQVICHPWGSACASLPKRVRTPLARPRAQRRSASRRPPPAVSASAPPRPPLRAANVSVPARAPQPSAHFALAEPLAALPSPLVAGGRARLRGCAVPAPAPPPARTSRRRHWCRRPNRPPNQSRHLHRAPGCSPLSAAPRMRWRPGLCRRSHCSRPDRCCRRRCSPPENSTSARERAAPPSWHSRPARRTGPSRRARRIFAPPAAAHASPHQMMPRGAASAGAGRRHSHPRRARQAAARSPDRPHV
mmetsp:Transcript_51819/g.119126  ORF Transcript_51819/g.119126 Transcript_51819/m.119126 type:complete len:253 (-) Transcript_51819:173-931(-)